MSREICRMTDVRGVTQNIDYKGYRSDDYKYECMRRSKIFMMTSYFESFGNVIVEAMSVGIPVVAYELPHYDQFGSGMIRVPVGDHLGFAEVITTLMSNKDYYDSVSYQAWECSKHFSWKEVAKELKDVIAIP